MKTNAKKSKTRKQTRQVRQAEEPEIQQGYQPMSLGAKICLASLGAVAFAYGIATFASECQREEGFTAKHYTEAPNAKHDVLYYAQLEHNRKKALQEAQKAAPQARTINVIVQQPQQATGICRIVAQPYMAKPVQAKVSEDLIPYASWLDKANLTPSDLEAMDIELGGDSNKLQSVQSPTYRSQDGKTSYVTCVFEGGARKVQPISTDLFMKLETQYAAQKGGKK